MDVTGIVRRFGFPLLGLGILTLVVPGLLPGTMGTKLSVEEHDTTDQGYRDLWVSKTESAITGLTLAVRSDPASPERWADLADALITADRESLARQAIDRAVASGPGLPHVRMRAANLSFRMGDSARGVRESAAAVAEAPEYSPNAFQAWHRLGGGAENVFREAAPSASLAAEYFIWLTGVAERSEIAAAWKLLGTSVTEPATLAYIDFLIGQREYAMAAGLAAGLPRQDRNLLRDGGFENFPERANGTVRAGWRIEPMAGVAAEADPAMFRSGKSSLRVRFTGTNPEYRNVTQRLVLAQGTYRVTALMRAEKISSEQGVSIRLGDADDEHHFAASLAVSGTAPWRQVEASLFVGPGARLVEVSISRRASWGFDTPLSGTVWVDDVRLVRVREGS